jgi:rhamnose transport system permease protein
VRGRLSLLINTLFQRREAGNLVMIALFTIIVGAIQPRFLSLETLRIVMLAVPLIMIAAMGQMMVIVARHVDLSMGSILGFSAIVAGMMFRDLPGSPILVAVLVAIALGALLGLLNGVIVTLFRLPSIIVTLGTLTRISHTIFARSTIFVRQFFPFVQARCLVASENATATGDFSGAVAAAKMLSRWAFG